MLSETELRDIQTGKRCGIINRITTPSHSLRAIAQCRAINTMKQVPGHLPTRARSRWPGRSAGRQPVRNGRGTPGSRKLRLLSRHDSHHHRKNNHQSMIKGQSEILCSRSLSVVLGLFLFAGCSSGVPVCCFVTVASICTSESCGRTGRGTMEFLSAWKGNELGFDRFQHEGLLRATMFRDGATFPSG